MTGPARLLLAALLLLLLAVPPLAAWWKAALVRHMLVQIPLLVVAGLLVGPLLWPARRAGPGWGQAEAVAAVLAGLFCLAFWMLPRWLDAAVSDPAVDGVKIASLFLLGGVPLGWGWVRLRPVARGFVWAHAVTMLAVVGLLYRVYPDRLCNSYLLGEQAQLGTGTLLLAGVLGLVAVAPSLFGRR